MNMNIYANCVKIPNNTNQDMQEKRQSAHKDHFLSIYNVVTLKIRSRSSKSNHLYLCICAQCISASLVKFQTLVKEIVCTQTFYCIKKFYKGQ